MTSTQKQIREAIEALAELVKLCEDAGDTSMLETLAEEAKKLERLLATS